MEPRLVMVERDAMVMKSLDVEPKEQLRSKTVT
eukprot:SAG22_NODE_10489_length_528_cov_1.450346_1_plen_33_part_00